MREKRVIHESSRIDTNEEEAQRRRRPTLPVPPPPLVASCQLPLASGQFSICQLSIFNCQSPLPTSQDELGAAVVARLLGRLGRRLRRQQRQVVGLEDRLVSSSGVRSPETSPSAVMLALQ